MEVEVEVEVRRGGGGDRTCEDVNCMFTHAIPSVGEGGLDIHSRFPVRNPPDDREPSLCAGDRRSSVWDVYCRYRCICQS